MRFATLAFVVLTLVVSPGAFAQNTEMDAAKSEMRSTLAPAGVEVERVSPDEVRLRMPSDITFAFNRADVRREFMPSLRDLARTLSSRPGMSVDIVGHADAIGSDAYNQELSERRARSVGAALIDHGVAWRRIEASGRGEWEPVASNADEWGRAQNRRVEIRIRSGPK